MCYNNRIWRVVVFAQAAALASLLCGAPALGETKLLDKRGEIREILTRTDGVANAKRGASASVPMLIQVIRSKHPEISPAQTQELMDLVKSTLNDQSTFIERNVIDAYDETFSTEEIDALYRFYSSPTGAAIASKLGAVTQNAMEKGRIWGQTIFAPEVLKRIKASETIKNLAQ